MSYFEDLSAEEKAALKEEFEREDTTHERRVELLTLVRDAANEAKQLAPCPRCKNHLFYAPHTEALIEGHVYSQDGMAEISITGYCEFCFDLVTKEPDEEGEWGEAPEDVLLCTFEDEIGDCVLSYGHDGDHLIHSRGESG